MSGPGRAICWIVLVVSLSRAGGVWDDFVYDDLEFITNNVRLRGPVGLREAFSSPLMYSASGKFYIYRPLAALSFADDLRRWGLSPFEFHLRNEAWHIAAALVAVWVGYLLTRSMFAAVLAATIFGIHPIQTEAVTWISGRANAISLTFFLLAFGFYVHSRQTGRSGWRCAVSLVLYAVALLGKEMAISLPLVVGAYDIVVGRAWRKGERGGFALRIAGFAAVSIAYVAVRVAVLGRVSQCAPWGGSRYVTALTMLKGFVMYGRLLVLPCHLNLARVVPLSRSIADPSVIRACVILAVGVLVIVQLARRSPTMGFAALWVLCALGPVSNVIPLRALVAERFLYFSVIGFALLAAVVGSHRRARPLALCMVALFATGTLYRTAHWRHGLTLWSQTLRNSPRSPTALGNLGIDYLVQGRPKSALRVLQKAARLGPTFVEHDINLGKALRACGQSQRALDVLRSVLRREPSCASARFQLGVTYESLRQTKNAAKEYESALSDDGDLWQAAHNLAAIETERGNLDEAVRYHRMVLESRPTSLEALVGLAHVRLRQEHWGEAAALFEKTERIAPNDADVAMALATAYVRLGRTGRAIAQLRRALSFRPSSGKAHFNLAVLLADTGSAVSDEVGSHAQLAKQLGYPVPDEFMRRVSKHSVPRVR